MKTINDWLNEYCESHKNETSKLIHWVCVSSIYFSIVGLLYSIKIPFTIVNFKLNIAVLVIILITFIL